MESNRKVRGLTKAKMQAVRAFYRAASAKPSSPTTKVKPGPREYDYANGINGYGSCGDQMKHHMRNGQINPSTAGSTLIVMQDRVYPQQQQKVTINVVTSEDSYSANTNKFDQFYGAVPVDEAIDSKASIYISRVQERFKLEQTQ